MSTIDKEIGVGKKKKQKAPKLLIKVYDLQKDNSLLLD